MSEHIERAGANPAEADPARMPTTTDRLMGDLSEMHGLLRRAAGLCNIPNIGVNTQMAAMNTTARVFKATCDAYQLLARLRGEIPETRHRTIVEHVGNQPQGARAAAATTHEEIIEARRKLRELCALDQASRGTPSENLKTTSGPRVR